MRTVVALFDRFEDAQQAIQALHDSGFSSNDVNIVARDASGEYSRYLDESKMRDTETGKDVSGGAATGAGIGAVLGGLGGLLAGLGALMIPGIGPVIAAGPIVGALAGAGVGAVAGGVVGALVDLGVPEEHAEYYAEGVRRGGTLITVRTEDDRAEQARTILNRYNPVDVDSSVQTWRQGNWTHFDHTSDPLTSDQMEFNRSSMPVTGSRMDDEFDNRGMSAGTGVMNDRDVMSSTDSMTASGETMRDRDLNVEDYNRDRDLTDRDVPHDRYTTGSQMRDQDMTSSTTDPTLSGRDLGQNYPPSNVPMDQSGMEMSDDDFDMQRNRQGMNENVPVTGPTMDVGQRDAMRTSQEEWDRFDMTCRRDFMDRYATSGRAYDYYQPAYRYGYDLAMDDRYRGYDWDRVEMEARRDWEMRGHQSAWDDVKDAVRHAWQTATRR